MIIYGFKSNSCSCQPYLKDSSQHAGGDALSLPSHQAATDWLKSSPKETYTFLTLSLLTHEHTFTWKKSN